MPQATKAKKPAKAATSRSTPNAIKMIACESSNVKGYGYNPVTRTLRVWFLNGNIYEYAKVATSIFAKLKRATSVGSFLNQNVFKSFKATKVEEK